MIDPNLPLELEDGTPVTLSDHQTNGTHGHIYVIVPKGTVLKIKGNQTLNGPMTFYYHSVDGVYGGDWRGDYKRLRNANVVDETEGFFT